MRPVLYAAVFLLMAMASCKKSDPNIPGVPPGTVTPTPPPPGFSFPKTYITSNPQTAFSVWVDEKDATPRFKPEFFFKEEPHDFISTARLKFVNASSIEIIDGTGQFEKETAGYFFFRDTLFLVHPGRVNDTTPLGTGNYQGFTLSTSKVYISGKTGNPPSQLRITSDNVFAVTYQQLYDKYVTGRSYFSELDTVAIQNSWYSFR